MRKSAFLISLIIIVITGCSNEKKIPSGILKGEKWEAVLFDVISAERFVQQFYRDSSLEGRQAKTMEYYNTIFEIHNITEEKFFESLEFYLSRPDISVDVFDSLSSYGERMREFHQKPEDRPTLDE